MTELRCEIAVVGGGQAGVCAAIAAAQAGRTVILLQDRPVLGGNSSSEAGVPPHGAEAMAHNRNARDTGLLENLRLDYYQVWSPESDSRPHWDRLLHEACASEPKLRVLLNTRVVDCRVSGRRVVDLACHDSLAGETFGVTASLYIDATGDGFLSWKAGAEYRIGREGAAEFGERVFGKGVPDRKTLGCTVYGWAVERDREVPFSPPSWAVNYDSCAALRHRPHDKSHLFPTVLTSSDRRELQFFWWLEWGGHLDVLAEGDAIYRRLLAELFGVWGHLKNSCDEGTRAALSRFDLVRWSAFPLKRESRRVVGDYLLTENDLFEAPLFPDRIGFGGWPLDDHPPEGIESPEPACDQVFVQEPYSVPYRCVYARDFDNLFLAGRCMSVTHSALSSIRVMNTLGSLGEAVGAAAAFCLDRGITPSQAGEEGRVAELQQRLLDRDLHLIALADRNPANLALRASATASSQEVLRTAGETVGFVELLRDTAVQFPLSTASVDSLEVLLEAERWVSLGWRVHRGRRLGWIEGEPLVSGSLDLGPGQRWYLCPMPVLDVSPGDLLTLVLERAEGVRWAYGPEAYQTRWGVAYAEAGEGVDYHGRARRAPTRNPWVFVNHHGRLPAALASWLADKPGTKVHGKLYGTPLLRIGPEQHPYGPENAINGINRSEDRPNLWISGPGLPQWLRLSWTRPQRVRRIELIFDTNLDYSDQRYGFPRPGADLTIPRIIAETVKTYQVDLLLGNQTRTVVSVEGNRHRRRVHLLPEEVETQALVLRVLETWGREQARVFAVKVF